MFRALWSHSRNIEVFANQYVMRYRIPIYFPFEKEKLIYNLHHDEDHIYITAFNPEKEVLPLLQKDDELPGETPKLLPQSPPRFVREGEGEETVVALLREQQRRNQAEKVSQDGCHPTPERYSNYPAGWRSNKCCD